MDWINNFIDWYQGYHLKGALMGSVWIISIITILIISDHRENKKEKNN